MIIVSDWMSFNRCTLFFSSFSCSLDATRDGRYKRGACEDGADSIEMTLYIACDSPGIYDSLRKNSHRVIGCFRNVSKGNSVVQTNQRAIIVLHVCASADSSSASELTFPRIFLLVKEPSLTSSLLPPRFSLSSSRTPFALYTIYIQNGSTSSHCGRRWM